MTKKILRSLSILLVLIFTLQLYACGTLMYPERRGQKQGEIDVKVAVLDGLGLLFCIIPGVVAYIVDFSTGAIYLPAGKRNMVDSSQSQMKVVYLDKQKINDSNYIREVVTHETSPASIINWNNEITYNISRNFLSEMTNIQLASTMIH